MLKAVLTWGLDREIRGEFPVSAGAADMFETVKQG